MEIANRIVILGCPGSGKSTFARGLRDRTGLPLYHLDNLWWRADKTHVTRETFDRELAAILGDARWIIDGDYSRTYEVRIRACDAVVFLDFSEDECMDGVMARVGRVRSDIPWVEDAPDPELLKLVMNYRAENRPAVYALLAKNPQKRALVFRSRAEADRWLAGV